MFKFKHPISKRYEPIQAGDPDQTIKDAVDISLGLLGLQALEWDHRELYQESVNGSDPSTMKKDRISIYFKCSAVFNKCLSTRRSTEPIIHIHPIKQESKQSTPVMMNLEPLVKQSDGHSPITETAPASPMPVLETKPTFHSHIHANSSPSEQKQQSGYSHYHHHQTDSNNFKIDGSNNVAANTAGDGSIIGQDVKANKMQNIEKSNNTWRDCTVTPLTNMSSATTADGRQALKPAVDMTTDISDAIDEYKEAYLRDIDTTLNALDFVTMLNQRMSSVVHLDNIAYIDTSTTNPSQDLNLLYDDEDIKSWTSHGVATGFIVSPNLLLTNWHVFPTLSFAKFDLARVVFDYNQANSERKEGRLNPELFYWSNRTLDCCLIAFSAANGDTIVRNPIIISSENVEPLLNRDNRLTIIQHPEGKPKRLSLDGCTVKGQNINKGFIVYTNDTAGGSSGSPVFSRTWILVALHHAAVRLSTLTANGTTVKKRRLSGLTEKGEVLNQGTLISIIYQALLAHLQDMKSQVHTTPTVAPKITLLQELLLQDPKITSKIRKEIKA
jgi:V8-like Glu-specific endopeptidase